MDRSIFISYRRDDDRGSTGRLFDILEASLDGGQLFIDVDDIAPGDDFTAVIEKQISASDIVLVVIGKAWLDVRDASGQRRLDDPSDVVRFEVETALRMVKRVIPVLLDQAMMPAADSLPPDMAALSGRNAARLRHETFRQDANRLARFLQDQLAAAREYAQVQALSIGARKDNHLQEGASQVTTRINLTGRIAIWQTQDFRLSLLLLSGSVMFFVATLFDAPPSSGNSNIAPRLLSILLFFTGLGVLSEAGRGWAFLGTFGWRALAGIAFAAVLASILAIWLPAPLAFAIAVIASCLAAPLPKARAGYAAMLFGSALLTVIYGTGMLSGFRNMW